MQLGIDCAGQWNPHQFAIDMGWDYTCIEATAERGLSETDEAGLTEEQGAMLLDWCKLTVEEERRKP